jgi:hypothetical protein
VLQLEELYRLGIKPSVFQARLSLPEGQAAAVILDPHWISQEAPV